MTTQVDPRTIRVYDVFFLFHKYNLFTALLPSAKLYYLISHKAFNRKYLTDYIGILLIV